MLDELRAMLRQQFPPDTFPGIEILVLGSIAKHQCTRGSDIDFFGVTEQPVDKTRTDPIIRAVLDKAQAMGLDVPFAEGMNATFVPRAELETIAVASDPLPRVFRRTTLVTASASAYRPELRAAITRGVLSAFVGRERLPRIRGVIDQLLYLARVGNIVAEWRMTDRKPDGGYVHWAKTFTLYKVELASTLAAVIRASAVAEGRSRDALLDALVGQLDQPPFERLLGWYDDVGPAGQAALATIIAVTNDMLRMFGTEGVRPRLAAAADDAPTRELYQTIEQLGGRLTLAFVQLFYREPAFQPWTEELGVFG